MYANNFTLKFRDDTIQDDYQKMKDSKFMIFNKWILLFSFISAVSVAIFQATNLEKFDEFTFLKFNMSMNCVAIVIYLIFVVITFFTKNIQVLRWIQYIVFYFQIFVIIAFRFQIVKLINSISSLIFFEYLIEILVRLVWVILFIHSFIESFIINSLVVITVWLTVPFLYPEENYREEMINSLAYSFVIFSVIVIAYILERQQKIAYYFLWQSSSKANLLTNILDHINSGFVSVKSGKITYINSLFITYLEKLKQNSNYCDGGDGKEKKTEFFSSRKEVLIDVPTCSITNGNNYANIQNTTTFPKKEKIIYEDNAEIITSILKNMNQDILDSKKERKNAVQKQILEPLDKSKREPITGEDFFTKFSHKISKIQNSEQFILIGDSSFSIDDTEINFEIHCRYNSNNPEAELEILFNDVTRSKMREKNNAEYKYKTRFLSKVAHEFKNPIICITELIDQSIESLPKQGKTSHNTNILNSTNNTNNLNSTSNLSTNLKQIKALCSYIHLLVKDLNFYSQSNQGGITTFEKQETSLNDVVDFCKNITNALILKSNKSKAVDLLINVDKDVPWRILTDESRLKQLLVNLLSNAVKFTLYGHILLDVSFRKSKNENQALIKFMVKDTGVGIKTDKLEELINSSQKEQESKGECFGLSISTEIAQKIGKGLQFKSQVGQGSVFWFCLETFEDKIKLNSSISKCKSSKAVSKSRPFYGLEISQFQISVPSDEEISFTKNINYLGRKNDLRDLSDESRHTRQLDIIDLVKPKYLNASNGSSISNSSDSSCSQGSVCDNSHEKGRENFLNLSNNFNSSKLIFPQDKTSDKKRKKSGHKVLKIKKFGRKSRSQKVVSKDSYGSLIYRNKLNIVKLPSKPESKGSIQELPKIQINSQPINNFYVNNVNLTFTDPRIASLKREVINIIVTDDEIFTRQSTVRMINTVCKSLEIKINILEAEDGVETIYLVYKALLQGYRISLIFSDENMNFISGISSSNIIRELTTNRKIIDIPFYLVTAYDSSHFNKNIISCINSIYEKPLSRDITYQLMKNFLLNNI